MGDEKSMDGNSRARKKADSKKNNLMSRMMSGLTNITLKTSSSGNRDIQAGYVPGMTAPIATEMYVQGVGLGAQGGRRRKRQRGILKAVTWRPRTRRRRRLDRHLTSATHH